MAFYLRNSIRVGLRNFSLVGPSLNVSMGVPGFRQSNGPSAHYIRLADGCVAYRQIPRTSAGPLPVGGKTIAPDQPHTPVLREIESGDVTGMVDTSCAAVVADINTRLRKWSVAPLVVVLGIVGILMSHQTVSPVLTTGAALVAIALAHIWDIRRKTTVLMYDLEEPAHGRFKNLHASFNNLAGAAGIWHIDATGRVSASDRKYQAGAAALVRRKKINVSCHEPKFLRTNIPVPSIPVGRQTLYFLPDHVLVIAGRDAGGLSYESLQLSVEQSNFIETDGVPRDAQVVGSTWRYVNKSGGPDRRFKSNPKIPIARYEELLFRSSSGLNELIQVSRVGTAARFVEYLRKMVEENAPPKIESLSGTQSGESPKSWREVESLAEQTLKAVEEIIDLTRSATPSATELEHAAHDAEIQECMLALIAAVVVADNTTHRGEQRFLKAVTKNLETADQCRAFVEVYADKWKQISDLTPKYFEAVAQYDRTHQTALSSMIIEKLGQIVKCTAMADGNFAESEFAIASEHVTNLKSVFRKATWVVAWDGRNSMPKVGLESTFKRDEFGKRETV